MKKLPDYKIERPKTRSRWVSRDPRDNGRTVEIMDAEITEEPLVVTVRNIAAKARKDGSFPTTRIKFSELVKRFRPEGDVTPTRDS